MTKIMKYGQLDIHLSDEVDLWDEAMALARVGRPLANSNARIEAAVREMTTADGSYVVTVNNLGFPVVLVDDNPEG